MPITLYTTPAASPPARAVETIIKLINLDVEKHNINLLAGEHLQPWFVELNPTHQIPVLNDNGYVLTESKAIIAYLLTVYAPKEILEQYYPTDPKLRGIIDSRWHFENGVIFARIKSILLPMLLHKKIARIDDTEYLIEGLDFLEKYLDGKKFLAGDKLSVADISTITSIDLVEFLVPLKHYKNISAWAKRARETSPFYEEFRGNRIDSFAVLMKNFSDYNAEERWNQIRGCAKK